MSTGDIVLIPFPFAELTHVKARPAVVIAETADAYKDIIVAAISSGEANRRIKAPGSLAHRYYGEDFGHGLLPFTALAAIAGVAVPIADSLLKIGEALLGEEFAHHGRTAARMGIAGLNKTELIALVKGNGHGA